MNLYSCNWSKRWGYGSYDDLTLLIAAETEEVALGHCLESNILDWETKVGDAETTLYMDYYHHLKVEKRKQTDGTTIYIVSNRNTEQKFIYSLFSVLLLFRVSAVKK